MSRPHDLLRLRRAEELVDGEPATPWVVVRRAPAPPGHVAVGVRATHPDRPRATTVPTTAVAEIRPPESLAGRPAPDAVADLPALRALRDVAAAVAASVVDVAWGPIGDVGFALATGTPAVSADSGLDLLLRPFRLPARERLQRLHEELGTCGTRVDVVVETREGEVALAELVSGAEAVRVATREGAVLRPNPLR